MGGAGPDWSRQGPDIQSQVIFILWFVPKARKGESSHPHTPCLSSCSPRCYFLLQDRHIQLPHPWLPTPCPRDPGILPPSPDSFLFWRQEAERAKDLTLSLLLPASLSLRGGQPQLSILERPRQAQKQGTETNNWGWKGQTNKSPSL